MTEALPKGLVTNSEAISGDIGSIDYVAIEDIAQLWKVYTTNKAIFDGLVGPRLENFFWRIWGSPRIHHNIKGSTVAREFLRISEGPSFIRTTPTQSPTLNRRLPGVRSNSFLQHDPSVSDQPPHPGPVSESISTADLTPCPEFEPRNAGPVGSRRPSDDSTEGHGTPPSPRKEHRSVTFLPPILKKPRAGSQIQLPKTARVVSPVSDASTGGESISQIASSASDPAVESRVVAAGASSGRTLPGDGSSKPYPATPPLTRAEREASQKGPKRKTAFPANTASNRRRPGAVRRKSSQSSSGSASKVISPRLAAQGQEQTILESSILELPHNSLPDTTGDALSPLSRTLLQAATHKEESHFGRASSAVEVAGGKTHQDWLVDHDFRSRFVDRHRHENLAASLMHPVPKASAATAAAASFQASGTLDFSRHPAAKGKEKGKVEAVPLKPEAPSSSAATGQDVAISTASPRRSKSQLSLLLDRDRRLSEGNKRGQQREKHRKSSS